ncbi:MAG TPA: dihydroxyacetone kinase subunit DhaL [Chthoniobacterales bacterium]|nr:dihydroxyacetone kinase subunit DhaL [Chthoniobacterales bacterium]
MASESYPATAGRPLVLALVETIETNRGYLSEIDGAIGDGDHGINMSKGFALAKTRLAEQTISVSDGLALIGKTLMTEIGGAMGPIYGTFFIQMSLQAKNKPAIDAEVFGAMLAAARKGVEELGGAKPGDKTIMDTLVPAQEKYQAATGTGSSFGQALQEMAGAAESGKDSTRDLVARIGRASRLGERSRGTLDAGATSCALILRTFANVLSQG